MHGILLQPWTTIKGTSTTTSLAQGDDDALDLSAFEDFVAWVEVKELTAGGAASPTLVLETAPAKDELLFSPTGGNQTSVPLAVGVSTVRNLLNAPLVGQIPLARFLRWRVSMSGASSVWSVTFQVHLAAHAARLSP